MTDYFALIHKDPQSCYGLSFPDFPGCITAGETMSEAMKNASAILGFHINSMMKDGDLIPEPSSLDAITSDPENTGAIIALVSPQSPQRKAVRLNISIDSSLLNEIDVFAKKSKMTRSAFLAEAARERIRSSG